MFKLLAALPTLLTIIVGIIAFVVLSWILWELMTTPPYQLDFIFR